MLRPEYHPVKPKVLAKQLGLDKEGLVELRRTVKKLVRKKKLAFGPRHLVTLPKGQRSGNGAKSPGGTPSSDAQPKENKDAKKRITGSFSRAADGFGFVRPAGTKAADGRDKDIFVPADKTGDAAGGDTVIIELTKKRRGREMSFVGEVVEIAERYTRTFVGSYFESKGKAFVRVDGSTFSQPIWVGDPGAKNAQEDDKVVIEMVHFPTAKESGEAVITQVLGDRNQPGVDTQLVMFEFNLPTAFSEEVMEDARKQAELFDETVPAEGPRRDLTDVTVLTIDPKDARDFDDAISLRKLDNGHWELGVHIADVSHFVPKGSLLDKEAKDRATSVYLPDRVIPMLPEIISNNLASLQPDKVRYTKTAIIEFSEEGVPIHTELFSAAIKSDKRFTYEEVDQFLEDRTRWRINLDPKVFRLLDNMHKLAMILRARRMERGSLELSLPEVKLDLNKDSQVTGAHVVENTESHQIIEEFMLAANVAVAQKLTDMEWLFLRRIHDNPDPRKLKQLTEFVQDLGIKSESLESRFEIKRLLAEVLGTPTEYAINYAILRSMQKAVYGPDVAGHFALASENYCHFTSPIRRYPDLTVHRLIEFIERGEKPSQSFDEMSLLGEHCSEREQRAAKAERELKKLKLLNFLSKKIGEEMNAVVTGVESYGMFVQGLDIPAEGLVRLESLADDQYDFDSTTHSLNGRKKNNQFRLGDIIRVAVDTIDLDRRELNFRFIKIVEAAPRPKFQPKRSSKKEDRSKGKGKGKGKNGRKSGHPTAADKRKKKKRRKKKR